MDKSGFSDKKFEKVFKVMLTGNKNGIDPRDLYPYIKSYLGEIIK